RYKEWPISSWRQLIKACLDNHLGVVLIGMFDGHPPDATGQLYLKDEKVLNLLNHTSFNDLTKLICAAGCYVGTDTAVTHIAAATGTPTIALFGPSNPLVWGPWPSGYSGVPSAWAQVGTQRVDNVTLVQGSEWCVPCMNEGCSQHISSVSECLDNLNPNKVISATLRCFH
ncbi:MAG: glycosyltransferase family 9 protein, partial [Burkholderiales bacterium]|nr:glycosyltransferase family 9 protein [Burkholderiales bacterium]